MNRFQRACHAGTGEMHARTSMRERACMNTGDMGDGGCNLPLAMAYVPSQVFANLYVAQDGWRRGTIFADLDKPYEGGCGR